MTRYLARGSAFHAQRGFALVEVLIAFTIAAIVSATLIIGVSTAARSNSRSSIGREELRIARSRLEAVGIDEAFRLGTQEGSTNGLRWTQRVTKLNSTASPVSAAALKNVAAIVDLYWVEITVTGPDGQSVQLQTAKLGTPVP